MAMEEIKSIVARYAVLILATFAFIVYLRRCVLHKLSSYPGPRLAAITDFYGAWYAIDKRLHHKTYQDHAKHGPVIRQGPNKLVFNSVQALKDIYINPNVSKSHLYHAGNLTRSSGHYNTFNAVDKGIHRRKRQLVAPILSERSMRTFAPQMSTQVNIFLQQLLKSCQQGAVVDMTDRSRWLAMDIVGLLSFGYDLKLQTEQPNRFLPGALAGVNWRLNCYLQLPNLNWLETIINASLALTGSTFFSALTTMIKARTAMPSAAKHDLYAFLVDETHPDRPAATLDEIWSEAITFVAAGGDTTATAMSATLFYLTRNPDWKARVAAELDAAFSRGSDINPGPSLNSCHALRACLNEALRMAPPVQGTLWREQSPEETDKPFVVDGHVIPRGVQVGVNLYTLHHNEEYFPEPFTYNPQRWLVSQGGNGGKEKAQNGVVQDLAAFAPFSAGARSCPGKPMAYTEASVALARFIWYFEFEAAGTTATGGDVFRVLDVFSAAHDGPFLKLTTRGDRWKELVDPSHG